MQVSAEKYVTISAIRPLLHHLTENALKVEGSDSLAVQMMKKEMTKNLNSRYRGLGITELLNFACFVDPRFKSMPFLDEAQTQLLHDNVLAEMMKHVTPDPEQEEDTVSDSECVAEKEPVAKKPKIGLGKLLGGMFSKPGEKRQSPSGRKLSKRGGPILRSHPHILMKIHWGGGSETTTASLQLQQLQGEYCAFLQQVSLLRGFFRRLNTSSVQNVHRWSQKMHQCCVS